MTRDEVEAADAAVLRVYVHRLEGAVSMLIDRDGEWESDMTAAETAPNTMLGLIADGNRCSQVARGLPVSPRP